MKIIVEKKNEKKKKKIAIVKNNIAIRIAGKVSRYIDASMNRATPIINIIILYYVQTRIPVSRRVPCSH